MTQNPLSKEFLRNLVRKAEVKEVGHRAIFTDDELKLIKSQLKESNTSFTMRDRKFRVRYFTWKKQSWVTVKPVMGFVPMFSAPYDDVMKAESI